MGEFSMFGRRRQRAAAGSTDESVLAVVARTAAAVGIAIAMALPWHPARADDAAEAGQAVRLTLDQGQRVALDPFPHEHRINTAPGVVALEVEGDRVVVIATKPGEAVVHLLGAGVRSFVFSIKGKRAREEVARPAIASAQTRTRLLYRARAVVSREPRSTHAGVVDLGWLSGAMTVEQTGLGVRLANMQARAMHGPFSVAIGDLSLSLGTTSATVHGAQLSWKAKRGERSLRVLGGQIATGDGYFSRAAPWVLGGEARSPVALDALRCHSSGLAFSSLSSVLAAGCRYDTEATERTRWNARAEGLVTGGGGRIGRVAVEHMRGRVVARADGEVWDDAPTSLTTAGPGISQWSGRASVRFGPIASSTLRMGVGRGERRRVLSDRRTENDRAVWTGGAVHRLTRSLSLTMDAQLADAATCVRAAPVINGGPPPGTGCQAQGSRVLRGGVRWRNRRGGDLAAQGLLSSADAPGADGSSTWRGGGELSWRHRVSRDTNYSLRFTAGGERAADGVDTRQGALVGYLALERGDLEAATNVHLGAATGPAGWQWNAGGAATLSYDLPGPHSIQAEVDLGWAGRVTSGMIVGYTYRPTGSLDARPRRFSNGEVSGVVFEDLDLDGEHDDGEPVIAGAVVLLHGEGRAVTDAEGRYAFTGLDSGRYLVRIDSDSIPGRSRTSTPSPVSAELIEHRIAAANFGITRAGEVRGRVFDDLDGDGAPGLSEPGVGKVAITLRPASGTGGERQLVTDGYGYFRFRGVRPGEYVLHVDPAGVPIGYEIPRQVSHEFEIAELEEREAAFAVHGIRAAFGRVYADQNRNGRFDADEPVFPDAVIAWDGGQARTSADGRYVARDLPPGELRVRLAAIPAGCRPRGPRERVIELPERPARRRDVDFRCERSFVDPLVRLSYVGRTARLRDDSVAELEAVARALRKSDWVEAFELVALVRDPRRPGGRARRRLAAAARALAALGIAADRVALRVADRVHVSAGAGDGSRAGPVALGDVLMYVTRTDELSYDRGGVGTGATALSFADGSDELDDDAERALAALAEDLAAPSGSRDGGDGERRPANVELLEIVATARLAAGRDAEATASARARRVAERLVALGAAADRIAVQIALSARRTDTVRDRIVITPLATRRPKRRERAAAPRHIEVPAGPVVPASRITVSPLIAPAR